MYALPVSALPSLCFFLLFAKAALSSCILFHNESKKNYSANLISWVQHSHPFASINTVHKLFRRSPVQIWTVHSKQSSEQVWPLSLCPTNTSNTRQLSCFSYCPHRISTSGFQVSDLYANTASFLSVMPDAIFIKVTFLATFKMVEQFHLRPQAKGKTADIRENSSQVQSKRHLKLIL